ncbi:C40 family peptidase [Oceanimonas smirnovii]|uniref:C40 family peptidase n=1 Tax=Oceanimonas smirnovii TaxID=264574 RepID=UPI00036126F7|nr:C40 family peptidase [Oceanimonas smirnovii]
MTLDQQILAHARAVAPAESCGLVIEAPEGLRYYPAQNIGGPDQFEIDPKDWITAELAGEIVAVVHSHPDGPAALSAGDRLGQRNTGLPYWLAVGDEVRRFKPVPPLLGRQFDHGTTDCLSLILDAYHLSGLDLGEYERDDDWWNTEQDLYLQHLPEAGFEQVGPAAPPQLGDIILVCLGGTKACHGAVYLGDGYILHHPINRLSLRNLYGGTWLRQTHSIWRHKQWQQCDFTAICADLAANSGWM